MKFLFLDVFSGIDSVPWFYAEDAVSFFRASNPTELLDFSKQSTVFFPAEEPTSTCT